MRHSFPTRRSSDLSFLSARFMAFCIGRQSCCTMWIAFVDRRSGGAGMFSAASRAHSRHAGLRTRMSLAPLLELRHLQNRPMHLRRPTFWRWMIRLGFFLDCATRLSRHSSYIASLRFVRLPVFWSSRHRPQNRHHQPSNLSALGTASKPSPSSEPSRIWFIGTRCDFIRCLSNSRRLR